MTQKTLSAFRSNGRGLFRFRTATCCRRARISVWSAARSAKTSMILCMPERVSGGDAKFQGFCDGWNKWEGQPGDMAEFFNLCFHRTTYHQVQFLRQHLRWFDDRTDRFIAALCLGALHGESHRSPNYFSNRMPRTISTKPAYSVRWWRKNDCNPPARDVFSILRHLNDYRFKTDPPDRRGEVHLSDARHSARSFPHLIGRVTDIITSPPYLDTTNYHEDQWLRLWFLGGNETVKHPRGDGRHYNLAGYSTFLAEAWSGLAPLLAAEARVVIRIGGRKLTRNDALELLINSLNVGIKRPIHLVDAGVSSPVRHTQANAFRGAKPSPTVEHDFCFQLT